MGYIQSVRAMSPLLVLCGGALVLFGCRGSESVCPTPSVQVDPATIPPGNNDAAVTVTVSNPNPDNGREVVTELYAESGTFDDPFALETTYTCTYDVAGEVEICVDAIYGPPIGPGPGAASEVVAAAIDYLRAPTAYFVRPEDCLETSCMTVVCPSDKNECPSISELTVEPEVIAEGETATVRVSAEDPDDNPGPLVTTLHAIAGTFADPHALETTYSCDPAIGGPIEICVVASDGDDDCEVYLCTTVVCPGPAPDNICPVIVDLTSTPSVIPLNERESIVTVDAFDPDMQPEPLMTTLTASTGTFDDPKASTTLYRCGAPGQAQICVRASDGDCDKDRCITVQCPSTIPDNICPRLFVVNALPSDIPAGTSWTEVQVRAQDTDGGPFPITTTFSAVAGFFEDVHAADTLYHCRRSGLIEICADATDGACTKTLCTDVLCPDL